MADGIIETVKLIGGLAGLASALAMGEIIVVKNECGFYRET